MKFPNIKVHKHLSDGSYSKTRSGTDGQTDRQPERQIKLSKQSPSHVVAQKDLHMEKTCICLRILVLYQTRWTATLGHTGHVIFRVFHFSIFYNSIKI